MVLTKDDDIVVVGIDPGCKNTGIAVVRWSKGTITVPSCHWFCDHPELVDMVKSWVANYDPHFVGFETVFVGPNKKNALALSRLIGRMIQAMDGRLMVEVTPAEAHSAVGLSLRGSSDEAKTEKLMEILTPYKRGLEELWTLSSHTISAVLIAVAAVIKLRKELEAQCG